MRGFEANIEVSLQSFRLRMRSERRCLVGWFLEKERRRKEKEEEGGGGGGEGEGDALVQKLG